MRPRLRLEDQEDDDLLNPDAEDETKKVEPDLIANEQLGYTSKGIILKLHHI